ncbi:glutathione S-transferase C-terminal domain-containing protein [soil metagenome]
MSGETGQLPRETAPSGAFTRQRSRFTERISTDGSTGFRAEPGRYHLYVSLACPWAHRQLIVRRLVGLTDVVSVGVVDPIRDEQGWRFTHGPGHGPDEVGGFAFLREAYTATDPEFTGRVTVPTLWDRRTGRVVSNEFRVLDIQLATAFRSVAAQPEVDLYPTALRAEIDALDEDVYADVNNGVYRCGFAATQEAYEDAFGRLFDRLDALDARLARQRYLVGDQLTLADIRLFTTLVRFDAVYYSHFKCNRRRLVDYPHLWPYARDLFGRPAFRDTVDFDHIKRHYYQTHDRLNPTRIVPVGPDIDWDASHDRDSRAAAS